MSTMNAAELRFLQTLAGKLWFYEPRTFRLKSLGRAYTPDFYVVEDGCFYEVLGTRQAYSYQRVNIDAFRIEYPQYRLVLVNEGAWKNAPVGPRVDSPRRHYTPGRRAVTRRLRRLRTPIAERLLSMMADHGLKTISEVSEKTGVTYGAIYSRIVHGLPAEALDDVAAGLQ